MARNITFRESLQIKASFQARKGSCPELAGYRLIAPRSRRRLGLRLRLRSVVRYRLRLGYLMYALRLTDFHFVSL
jgi:hypothetical protein